MLFMEREEIERRLKEIDRKLAIIRHKMSRIGMDIHSKPFRLLAHQQSELEGERARLLRSLQQFLQGS